MGPQMWRSGTLAPRSGERVARAQRGPGEGQQSRDANLHLQMVPAFALTRLAASRLGTLSPLRGARELHVRIRKMQKGTSVE
jgi:hypothetical protein